MELNMRWNVPVPQFPFTIDHHSRLVCLGSCFAQEIGNRLENARIPTLVNPRGIIFDPMTLARSLQQLIDPNPYVPRIEFHGEEYHSLDHHGDFSRSSRSDLEELIRTADEQLKTDFPSTNVLVVTFGTSVAWVWNEDGSTVANCHKIPQTKFHRKVFTASEILEVWKPLVCALREENEHLDIVLTVSPVRYFKGDPQLNSTSKAHLILAAQELAQTFEYVHYFPAYELLLDDLRDYRFYKEDLRHPSELAISYIWEAFQKATMKPDVRELSHKLTKMGKAISHRPKAKSMEAHHQNVNEIREAQDALISEHYRK